MAKENTIVKAWARMRAEQLAANQHLLEQLGITRENIEEHKIYYNDKSEIIKVQKIMKATIWEKKQDAN